MKNIFKLIMASMLILPFVGCNKEPVEQPGTDTPGGKDPAGEVVFAQVRASVSNDADAATRSLLSINTAEAFYKATLFCFWDETNTNPDAGPVCQEGDIVTLADGSYCVREIGPEEKDEFYWDIPVGRKIKIYAIANYGDMDLTQYTDAKKRTSLLTTGELDDLAFICNSKEDFLKLGIDGYGIPESGVVSTTLSADSPVLSVKIKRLFAKYELNLNTDYYNKLDLKIECAGISSIRANRKVSFFNPGSKATSEEDLIEMDVATEEDLVIISEQDPQKAEGLTKSIALYIPENCQGNIGYCGHWYDVCSDDNPNLADMALCTAIDIKVWSELSGKEDHEKVMHAYTIYPGGDFTRNFDVERNVRQAVTLSLDPIKTRYALQIVMRDGERDGTLYFPCNGTKEIEFVCKGFEDASSIRDNMAESHSITEDMVPEHYVSSFYENDAMLYNDVVWPQHGVYKIKTKGVKYGTKVPFELYSIKYKVSDWHNGVFIEDDLVFDGENQWYMPNVQESDYVTLKCTKPTGYDIHELLDGGEFCLYGGDWQHDSKYYKEGPGYVPCTVSYETDPQVASNILITVKARYSDILNYYNGISNGMWKFRGTAMSILGKSKYEDGTDCYFRLGTGQVHLCFAVVSRLIFGGCRTKINGWDDDYFCLPTLYSDRLPDGAHWRFNYSSNDFDPDQGDFYLPVGVTGIQGYVQEMGNNRTQLTGIFMRPAYGGSMEGAQNAPYYDYVLSAYGNSEGVGPAPLATGFGHCPSITYNMYAGNLDGDPNQLRETEWYDGLYAIADKPNLGTWRGNLFYKLGWRLYDRFSSSVVEDGGYFDVDKYDGKDLYFRFYDSAQDIAPVIEEALN